jgi:hypothetical protein
MGRSKDNTRESVPTKPGMKSIKVPGPSKHDGRTGPRGTYQSQTKPAWDGPSVILKDGDD